MAIDKNSFPKVIDTDSPYDDNKNAADAKNVTYIGNDSRNVGHAMPILGNRPAFDMGSVSQQNKIYRVYIDGTGLQSLEITAKGTNTAALFVAPFTDTIADATSNIQIWAAAAGIGAVIIAGSNYIDVQLIPSGGTQAFRWYMRSTGVDELTFEVRQEAIEPTLAGELIDVGGYDLLGNLFIWSTSQKRLPTVLSVNIVNAFLTYPIQIVCDAPHGLVNNQWVNIEGVVGKTGANGSWSVFVLNALEFRIMLANDSNPYISGGKITIYPSGIGEIGVAQKNQATLNWEYTRLLRSTQWNWTTKKQFDVHCDQTDTSINTYSTNDNTVPVVFYYRQPKDGIFINSAWNGVTGDRDGALSFNGGQYDYDSVYSETALFLSDAGARIKFTNQLQSGGGLTAGNKRYVVRLLTRIGSTTNWSELSNPVSVYAASNQLDPEKIIGDVAGALTGKINILTVSNIAVDLFSFIELGVIEYAGVAVSGVIVRREAITGETMQLSHSGNEPNAAILDVTQILAITEPISTAKNIRAIDNRLLLSNLTVPSNINFLDFAKQIKHSIKRVKIPSTGTITGGITFGDYQDPINVNTKVGYMHNETYRFSCRLKYKSGGSWTQNYWIDDIRVDDYLQLGVPYNRGNPYGDNRRVVSLPDLALTDGDDVWVAYVEFTNINFDILVGGGQRLGDVFDEISFERAECIPEVLFTGMARMAIRSSQTGTTLPDQLQPRPMLNTGSSQEDYNNLGTTLVGTGTTFAVDRNYMAICSPDILLGGVSIEFGGGDRIINFGNPFALFNFPRQNADDVSFIELRDTLVAGGQTSNVPTDTHPVTDTVFRGFGYFGSVTLNNEPFQMRQLGLVSSHFFTSAQLVSTSGFLVNNGAFFGAFDFGYYYVQYYRPKINKYEQQSETLYVTCGSEYVFQGATPQTTFDVFGGDTFTQKTYMNMSRAFNLSPAQHKWNDGIAFYSQNRVNAGMRQKSSTVAAQLVFPVDPAGVTINDRIRDWLFQGNLEETLSYDLGYNIQNNISLHSAFDRYLIQNYDQPTRIRWSQLKPQNAIADLYRIFLPLDFKDLDNSDGEINHMEKINGELFTLQNKKWQRQFFNTRGTLQVQSISDVVIGDGSVMSRDGQTISNFGTQNKWAAILGKSKGGNDIIFWWDGINKMWMRFGGDGTLSLSEIKGMENFAANNLNWVVPNDTPADGEGIHGVWHQRMGEAIWFVRGKRGAVPTPTFFNGVVTVPFLPAIIQNAFEGIPMIWLANCGYVADSIVFYVPTTFSTFEQTGEFWKSLVANNTSTPALSNPTWEVIPHTDTNYYSEFSIAFNEKLNEVTQAKTPSGFSSFYTPLPMIAHEWTNGYVSPRPISPLSKHYEHNRGAYLTWYEHNGATQTEEGYVELVINKDTDMPMLYQALVVNAESRPYKISFYTQGQETFIVAADFEVMNGVWQAAIKNDITGVVVQPVNEQDTSQMFGTYIRVRFYFEVDKFNAINDFICKFIALHRNYQS